MGRRAKPAKTKVEGKRRLARKSLAAQDTRIRELEEALAESLKREAEALEQQKATDDILGVISHSPPDAQPVFETIAARAKHLCDAREVAVFRLNDDLIPKRLELLKALVPNLSKIALLREDVTTSVLPNIATHYGEQDAIAARGLGIEIHTFIVRRGGDLATAFLGMKKNHDQGVVVMSPAFMFVHRRVVLDLAASHRIAAIYELRVFVEPGGLMSYGVKVSEMERRAAVYVDKPQGSRSWRPPHRANDPAVASAAGGSGDRVDRTRQR